MKTFLALAAAIPFSLFGQITLTVSDFSDANDATWVSTAIDPFIDYSTTGPNTTWDFSSLTFQSQDNKEYFDLSGASALVTFTFGQFASAAYQATNYASSTAIPVDQITSFLPVTITDIYQFSKNSSSAIKSVGFALSINGTEIPFKSDTIETRYALPLNYGDTYSSVGYTDLDMNPIYNGIWRQHINRDSEVDGWGSVTTPHGTYNALRVRHLIQEYDSIYMDFSGLGTWIPLPVPDRYEYEWWANGMKEPVLRITTNVILGNETPTTIEYIDDYQSGAGLNELEQHLSVYPNPTTDEIHIEGISNYVYNILSADGKIVMNGESAGDVTVDVRSLAPGAYKLVVNAGGRFESISIVKK